MLPVPFRARSVGALAFIAALVAAPALAAAKTSATAKTAAARGEALAKKHCASCHAIGRTGASPRKEAPPLRILSAKYPLESLEEAFAEGIVVSHRAPEMPQFEMQPDDIADLIAHLRAISPKKKK